MAADSELLIVAHEVPEPGEAMRRGVFLAGRKWYMALQQWGAWGRFHVQAFGPGYAKRIEETR